LHQIARSANGAYVQSWRFRRDFGLSTNPRRIWWVLRNPRFYKPGLDTGVPLAPGEEREIRRRDRIHGEIGTIERYVDAHAKKVFAGIWIDQAHCGLIRVGFTVDPAPYMIDLVKLFPYPTALRSYKAGLNAHQLEALQRRIERDIPALQKQGFAIRTVGANVSTNIVEIGILHPTPARRAALRQRYGPHVRVLHAARAVRVSR
jgi:hypothetical protein